VGALHRRAPRHLSRPWAGRLRLATAEFDTRPHRHTALYFNEHAQAAGDRHAHLHPHCHPDSHAHGDSNRYPYCHAHALANGRILHDQHGCTNPDTLPVRLQLPGPTHAERE
jgi:hypothetical protein